MRSKIEFHGMDDTISIINSLSFIQIQIQSDPSKSLYHRYYIVNKCNK